MKTTSIETMAVRLDRLELECRDQRALTERVAKQNRLLRLAGAWLVLGSAALVIAGANRAEVPPEVAARRFALQDKDGNDRIVMSTTPSGMPFIFLMDKAKQQRIGLFIDEDGSPGMHVRDEQGKKRIVIAMPKQTGSPGILIQDKEEDPRFMMGVAQDGSPDLYLLGKDYKVLFKAPSR